MHVSLLFPGIENHAYLIAAFIFLAIVTGILPLEGNAASASVSHQLFEHIQRRVFLLYATFFTFIVLAKIVNIPLWLPAIVVIATGLWVNPVQKKYPASVFKSLLFAIFCLALSFKLGNFGAMISKWDGNAHQTIISQLTHYNTLLLYKALRLDDRFAAFASMNYYPYLGHSIIAAYSDLLAAVGVTRQPAWLAISVVLPILTASTLVVAASRMTGKTSTWHLLAAFLLVLSVPATVFTESHHGSFARACSSVLALGLYTQWLGKFDTRSAFYKASIGIISFALHLQGAVFFALYFIAEQIIEICTNKTLHFKYLTINAIAILIGCFAFTAGNSIYAGGIDADILRDLFSTWRLSIIPNSRTWISYSIHTVFSGPGRYFGEIFFALIVTGIFSIFKTRKYELYCAAVFIALILFYTSLLLFLPNSQFLLLLARPFVGVISRLYEAIGIIMAVLAAAGLLTIMGSLQRSSRGRLACSALLLFYAHSAYGLQGHLSELASYFDTLRYDQLSFLSSRISKSGSHALLITTDLKFTSVGNGDNITSYLSYYDCPFPTEKASQCQRKIAIAKQFMAMANTNTLPDETLSSYIASFRSAGFDQIFVITTLPKHTEHSEGNLYKFDERLRRFVLLFSTEMKTEDIINSAEH